MILRTQYHNLTDDELLAQVNDERDSSDIIEELCQRLELMIDIKKSLVPSKHKQ